MKHALATTVSRRAWLSRLLMAAAVAPVAGVRLADTVNADKKKKIKSIKTRVQENVDACTENDGTATITNRPGGTTVACGFDNGQGYTCTHSSKKTRCHATLTNPPKAPLDDVSTPPTGGNEDPTDGGGGNKAGGGAAVPPGGSAEDPNDSPAGEPVLE